MPSWRWRVPPEIRQAPPNYAGQPNDRDGIAIAFRTTVSQALRKRFERIRRAEIERLNRKLRGLSDANRRSLETITREIVQAICRVPERALAEDANEPALEALVRLFAVDPASAAPQ
jgi:hypothetical protein